MKYVICLILILLSFSAFSQEDSVYDIHTVIDSNIIYRIKFSYMDDSESKQTFDKTIGVLREDGTIGDSTYQVIYYKAKAVLMEEIDGVLTEVTDHIDVPYVPGDVSSNSMEFISPIYLKLKARK